MRPLPPTAGRARTSTLRALLVMAALAPGLAACGDDEAPVAGTSAPILAPTTTTTATTEPAGVTGDLTSVPDEPDADYVEAVMEVLDVALRDAFAGAVARHAFDEEFETRLRALYAGPEADDFLAALHDIGVEAFAPDPGRPTTTVVTLRTARADCISFTAERDLSVLNREPYEPLSPYHLHLARSVPGAHNPTPWVLARDVVYADGSDPGDPCER